MNTGTAFVLTHESNPQRQLKAVSLIALAITRSLGRQGVPVVRIHPNRLDHSLTSKYCSAVEISPDFYASEANLLKFLLEMRSRYEGPAVLIPASDDCAYFISKHHDALSPAFSIVAPRWSVMAELIDKRRQYEQAEKLGIPIPETYFPESIEGVRTLAYQLQHYPYVIKPLVAHNWRLASMKGVSQDKKGFAVESPEALISRYEAISQGDKAVMIQEVIGGKDDRLFTFMGCFNQKSQPIGYCIRKKVRQLPIDFGYCTMTVSWKDETVRTQSLQLLEGVGYEGIVGVEWKHDPRTGQYKLIEINARAVNTTGLSSACGVDIPYLAFNDRINGTQTPVTEWQEGVKWINFEQDFWAARELHQLGRLGWWEWLQSIAGKKVGAIYAFDDLRPFLGHFQGLLRSNLSKLYRRRRTQERTETVKQVPGMGVSSSAKISAP